MIILELKLKDNMHVQYLESEPDQEEQRKVLEQQLSRPKDWL